MTTVAREYQIVQAETLRALTAAVSAQMADGWNPVGGVVPDTLFQAQTRYLQSMVRTP